MTALAVVRDAVQHGLAPVVVDRDMGVASRSRWLHDLVQVGSDPLAAMQGVLALGEAGKHLLIATSDHWVDFIRQHRARLDAAYACVIHPDNDTLDICLHKKRFVAFCREHALPVPQTWFAGEEARPTDLPLPVIVRPALTQHGASACADLPKAVEAHTEAELTHWLDLFKRNGRGAVVSSSLLSRRLTQYSVAFASGHAQCLSFVARKVRPLPDRCTVGSCVELHPHAEVEALARRAIEHLAYFGIGEVEILHDQDTQENFLIEINARPWMQYGLVAASHHDFLGLVLGRTVQGKPDKTGHQWLDLSGDLYNGFSRSAGAVRRGEVSMVQYITSLARSNVFATFDWHDLGPAFPALRRQRITHHTLDPAA